MKDKERIIRKIERCMALSKSANEHEAATAIRQAKALMEKHQIEMSELGLAELSINYVDSGRTTMKAPPTWTLLLWSTVSEAFGCTVLRGYKGPVFIGTSPAPKIASYTLSVLERQLQRGKKNYIEELEDRSGRKINRSAKIRLGRGYCEGWAYGCKRRVQEFARPLSENEVERHLNKVESESFSVREPDDVPKSYLDDKLSLLAGKSGFANGCDVQLHYGMDMDKNDCLSLES